MHFRESPEYCQGILVSKFFSLTPSMTDRGNITIQTYMQLINHF